MAYRELRKHILLGLSFNKNYLEEQINILDDELALFKTIGLEIENEEQKTKALDMLLKIREDLRKTNDYLLRKKNV